MNAQAIPSQPFLALVAVVLSAGALIASVVQGRDPLPRLLAPQTSGAQIAAAPGRMPATGSPSARGLDAPMPTPIGFRQDHEREASRDRRGQDALWLDLSALESQEAAVDMAAFWRHRLGPRATLECWVTGPSKQETLAAAQAITHACSQVWVVD